MQFRQLSFHAALLWLRVFLRNDNETAESNRPQPKDGRNLVQYIYQSEYIYKLYFPGSKKKWFRNQISPNFATGVATYEESFSVTFYHFFPGSIAPAVLDHAQCVALFIVVVRRPLSLLVFPKLWPRTVSRRPCPRRIRLCFYWRFLRLPPHLK